MSEAVNETGVTINHAQYIRNPRCGNLLEEGIVDQMMFAGRRQAEAFTLGLRKMIFRLSSCSRYSPTSYKRVSNSMAICLISFSGSSANFVKWLC